MRLERKFEVADRNDSLCSLSKLEIAELLGVAQKSVTAWIRTYRLPAFNVATVGRPRWRFLRTDVEQFMSANKKPKTAQQNGLSIVALFWWSMCDREA